MQWGDEGKGKVIDLLSSQAEYIVRSQGGNNAGHTIMVGTEEYRFHLIPSGILYPHVRCYITGGTAIDPEVLLKEIRGLEERGIELKGRLFISPYAHLIFSYHRSLDKLYEAQKGEHAIGTTGRGIGPCYADRVSRIGVRMGEFVRPDIFKKRLKQVVAQKNQELTSIFHEPTLDFEEIFAANEKYAKLLAPYVYDVENFLAGALKKDSKMLFEGAHGTFLDVTFGTYPYVTSSSTIAAGICNGAGVGPSQITRTLGVIKAYTTRVGNGPLPTAINAEDEKLFLDHTAAREIGTTTGRKRRIGWFDGPLGRFAARLNGANDLAVTKLDVLDHLPSIKVCKGYMLDGEMLEIPPSIMEDFQRVQPVYEVLDGWQTSTREATSIEQLPKNARKYLNYLESLCEVPIGIISLGPEREKTLILKDFFTN
jgi:adenylosuccinate synthase